MSQQNGGQQFRHTPLYEYLENKIVIGKNEYSELKSSLFCYDKADSEISEKDMVEDSFYRVNLTPLALKQLLDFPDISKKVSIMTIEIPDKESISFKKLIEDLDLLPESKEGRQVSFSINSIPSQFSKEDIEALESRFGIKFTYQFPIETGYADLSAKNRDYVEEKMDSTDVIEISSQINELVNKIKNSNVGNSLQDKINAVNVLMKENFKLEQEELGVNSFGMVYNKSSKICVPIKNSPISDIVLDNPQSKNNSDRLLSSLKTKNLTPQIYIVIVNELLRRLNIEVSKNAIIANNGKLEPVIKIKGENKQTTICLNGISGVSIEDEVQQRQEKYDEYGEL